MGFHRAITMMFLFLFSAGLASAQQAPVTDLVIRIAENQNDVILNWTRPLNADSFHVYTGESSDFQIADSLLRGATADTSFTHVNALVDSVPRFYVVVAETSTPEGMVLVPAGPYDMGATYQTYAQPIHTVTVPVFYIDIYEVTNAQYKAFCDATGRTYPTDPTSGFYAPPYFSNPVYANYPVVRVDWYDAGAYATWAGKRLPTEAEWERAAKGNADNRQWSWGDTWVAANANVGSGNADGYTYTSPVGNYPSGISPVGCYDMTGNVWEWCEDDWHSSYTGAPSNGSAWVDNPRGSTRILRGGSWYGNHTDSRCAVRTNLNPSSRSYNTFGFRCARTP